MSVASHGMRKLLLIAASFAASIDPAGTSTPPQPLRPLADEFTLPRPISAEHPARERDAASEPETAAQLLGFPMPWSLRVNSPEAALPLKAVPAAALLRQNSGDAAAAGAPPVVADEKKKITRKGPQHGFSGILAIQRPAREGVFTLGGTIQATRANNQQLAAAGAQYRATKELLPQARATRLPVVDGVAELDGQRAYGDEQDSGDPSWTSSANVGLDFSQPVFDGFKGRNAVSGAQSQIRAARSNLANLEQTVLLEVVAAPATSLTTSPSSRFVEREARRRGVKIVVFPEMCLVGYWHRGGRRRSGSGPSPSRWTGRRSARSAGWPVIRHRDRRRLPRGRRRRPVQRVRVLPARRAGPPASQAARVRARGDQQRGQLHRVRHALGCQGRRPDLLGQQPGRERPGDRAARGVGADRAAPDRRQPVAEPARMRPVTDALWDDRHADPAAIEAAFRGPGAASGCCAGCRPGPRQRPVPDLQQRRRRGRRRDPDRQRDDPGPLRPHPRRDLAAADDHGHRRPRSRPAPAVDRPPLDPGQAARAVRDLDRAVRRRAGPPRRWSSARPNRARST